MFIKICAQCGSEFSSTHRAAKFCDHTCQGLNQRHPFRKAKRAFCNHRCSAKARGISWFFTFEEWYEFWQKSGKWEQRGLGVGKYCMARFGDTGPYHPGNVAIKTVTENLVERAAPVGNRNGCAKLTEEDILAIRDAEGKLKRPVIAEHYSINVWHVRDIQKRRCWKHI